MDEQILRSERGSAGGQIGLGVLMSLLAGTFAVLMFKMALPLPFATIIMIVLGLELVMIVTALIVESQTPYVSRGPRAIGQVYTTAPAQMVAGILQNGMMHEKFQSAGWQGTTLHAMKKMSAWSWGTTLQVDIRPSADRPGQGVVTVLAMPKAPFQLSDWGQNKRLVTRMLQAVPGGVPARMSAVAQAPGFPPPR